MQIGQSTKCLCSDKNRHHMFCLIDVPIRFAHSRILRNVYLVCLLSQHLIPSFNIVVHENIGLLNIIKLHILALSQVTNNWQVPSILKSTYYHSKKRDEGPLSYWRKSSHIAIKCIFSLNGSYLICSFIPDLY